MEEIDEALERLEVEEPIRVEMRCEISGDVRIRQFCWFGCSSKMLFICFLSSFSFAGMVDLMILEEMATLHVSDIDIRTFPMFGCSVALFLDFYKLSSWVRIDPTPPRLEAFDARD